jgi:hypothetical protein
MATLFFTRTSAVRVTAKMPYDQAISHPRIFMALIFCLLSWNNGYYEAEYAGFLQAM